MTDEERARDALTDAIGIAIASGSTAFGSLIMDPLMARVSEALGEWKREIVSEAVAAQIKEFVR